VLREHIGFVRQRLMQARDAQRDDAANEAEGAEDGSDEAGAGPTPPAANEAAEIGETRDDHDAKPY
jgi:hypothetical protein